MSLRGVSFEIPNEPGRLLIDILSAIEMKAYDWFLRNFDFPIQTMDGEWYDSLDEFSVDQKATGRELAKWLRGPSNYLIFAELFAFESGQTEEVGMTYEWFQESNCHIADLDPYTDKLFGASEVNELIGICELLIQRYCIPREAWLMSQANYYASEPWVMHQSDKRVMELHQFLELLKRMSIASVYQNTLVCFWGD